MRLIATIISIVLILMGGLWALQGIGMVGGSFMTGSQQWLYIGIATALVGLVALFVVRRRPSA